MLAVLAVLALRRSCNETADDVQHSMYFLALRTQRPEGRTSLISFQRPLSTRMAFLAANGSDDHGNHDKQRMMMAALFQSMAFRVFGLLGQID